MTLLKSPYATTITESWAWAINELEQTLARTQGPDLRPLIDLARQVASTTYSQSFRAGTSLRQTLVISTALEHGLTDEPHITVEIEPTSDSGCGFCILYYGGKDWDEVLGTMIRSYGTDDHKVIAANLRRDLPGYYYPCACADGWKTLEPLLVRLWEETHPT